MSGWGAAAGAAFGVFGQYQKNKQLIKENAKQVYNYTASRIANNLRSSMIIDAGIKNISAVRQEQVLHNQQILEAEREAHANAEVIAAAAGVEGGSVYDVKYNQSSNAAKRINQIDQETDAAVNNYVNSLYGPAYDMAQPFRPPEFKINKWEYLMAGVQGAMGGMGSTGLQI